MVCAFTGHRPEHLPWRTDETDARCAALKAVLQREVSALYQRAGAISILQRRFWPCGTLANCRMRI